MIADATGPLILSESQFLARLAVRLSSLPNPLPDCAVLVIHVPDLVQLRQGFGAAAADLATHCILDVIFKYWRESLIIRLADGNFAFTFDYDAAWINVADIVAEVRQALAAAGRLSSLLSSETAIFGAAVHSGRPASGTSLQTAHELLRQASLAAQLARNARTNNFLVYRPEHDEQLRSASRFDRTFRRAVADDEFRLHYQPMVDLRTHEIVALEALVRWNHPAQATRSPDQFIPTAESTGLIVKMGAVLLRSAMLQADEWMQLGWTVPRIAVNVSATQLSDPAFLAIVDAAINSGAAQPRHLELEITEQTFVNTSSNLLDILSALRRMGVSIALDDFGTSSSSLQFLRDMPIDKVKIDREFIRGIVGEHRNQAIVRAIVGMADAFGISVVAEGIEDQDQADATLSCGCSIGQGYLYAKPAPPERIPAMAAELRGRLRPVIGLSTPHGIGSAPSAFCLA